LNLSAADKLCEVLGLHFSPMEGFVAQWKASSAPPGEGAELAPRKPSSRPAKKK
jgi:hypothetical protein